ncbi:ester cyclase [Methyloparacoccus murrellii]
MWEQHVGYEFETRDTESTLDTMVPHACVNHIPVMTGGRGREELRRFYGASVTPQMPPDTRMTLIGRTVGHDRLVDEMVFEFTHTLAMPWLLPGVPPTGRHVKVMLVASVGFEGDRLVSEHIYWDQATVLVQLGLLDPTGLPVCGAESTDKALDPALPARQP